MADTAEDVAELKRQAEAAQAAQNRAAAQAEAAEAEYQRLLEKLRTEFGVSSEEEATVLLEKLDAELAAEMKSIREQLAAAKPEEQS